MPGGANPYTCEGLRADSAARGITQNKIDSIVKSELHTDGVARRAIAKRFRLGIVPYTRDCGTSPGAKHRPSRPGNPCRDSNEPRAKNVANMVIISESIRIRPRPQKVKSLM